jgi:hypothetical protein
MELTAITNDEHAWCLTGDLEHMRAWRREVEGYQRGQFNLELKTCVSGSLGLMRGRAHQVS